jgi:hypothetical protein
MAPRNVGRSKPYQKIQQAGCHPDRQPVPSARGSIVSLEEPRRSCSVIKTFVKIGVSMYRELKENSSGRSMKTASASMTPIPGETEQHAVKPCKE